MDVERMAAFIAALEHCPMPLDAQAKLVSSFRPGLYKSISLHAQLLAHLITSHGWCADRDHHAVMMHHIISARQLHALAYYAPALQPLAEAWD